MDLKVAKTQLRELRIRGYAIPRLWNKPPAGSVFGEGAANHATQRARVSAPFQGPGESDINRASPYFMKSAFLSGFGAFVLLAGAMAQTPQPAPSPSTFVRTDLGSATLPLESPRMAPELALSEYQQHSTRQAEELVSYSARMVVHAELPDTSQSGEYELQQHYAAPRTLEFKALHYTGDGFVKSNVITRLLQSEVEHVQKDDMSRTVLNANNYKFSYKGTGELRDRLVHLYQVKPIKKRAGLFRGHIFLDVHTGTLVRAEGSLVKSPSLFIKKVDFVQDYADVGPFTLPVHIHSEAKTRLVGRAVVDIYQHDYQPVASTTRAAVPISTP